MVWINCLRTSLPEFKTNFTRLPFVMCIIPALLRGILKITVVSCFRFGWCALESASAFSSGFREALSEQWWMNSTNVKCNKVGARGKPG